MSVAYRLTWGQIRQKLTFLSISYPSAPHKNFGNWSSALACDVTIINGTANHSEDWEMVTIFQPILSLCFSACVSVFLCVILMTNVIILNWNITRKSWRYYSSGQISVQPQCFEWILVVVLKLVKRDFEAAGWERPEPWRQTEGHNCVVVGAKMSTPKGRVEKRAPVGLACVLEHSPDRWKRANLHADGNTRQQVISALLAKINQNNRLLMAEQMIGLM